LVYTGVNADYTCNLSPGYHLFQIEVIDVAGNMNSSYLLLQVDLASPGTGNPELDRFLALLFSPPGLMFLGGLGLIIIMWGALRRRKSRKLPLKSSRSKKKHKK
jgi:hypothetical protein